MQTKEAGICETSQATIFITLPSVCCIHMNLFLNWALLYFKNKYFIMKCRITPLVLILSAACLTLTAQTSAHRSCGTHGEMAAPMVERLLQNIESLRNNPVRPRNIEYVPIKFHLVAKTDGTGRVTEGRVLDQLCALNVDYLPMNIQFYLKNGTFNYINNTAVYSTHTATINTIMTFARDNTAVNVFIVDDATPAGGGVGGVTLGYYTPNKDWIVMRRDETNASTTTLPHEMGHFFSLPHPFNGWDSGAYDPAVHGVPAPAMSPGGIPTEKADGSNCAIAGDFICDTPADYRFEGNWNCNYTGGAMDPMGMLVNPDERLFMCYMVGCQRNEYIFSPTQQELIIEDLNSNARNYVTPGYVPYQVEITETPELIAPINAVVTPGYNIVNLEWSGVSGATRYLLEIDAFPNFSSTTARYVVFGTNKILTNLAANKTYFWRIRPFAEYHTCSPFTANGQFKTGTGTITSTGETKLVENWSVNPNPVSAGQDISVSINSNERFDGVITVLNTVGQVVYRTENLELTQGEHDFRIPSSFLTRGVYLVALETSDVVLTKRVVVGN